MVADLEMPALNASRKKPNALASLVLSSVWCLVVVELENELENRLK